MVIPQKIKNKINILPSNFTYGAYGCIYIYTLCMCVWGGVCVAKSEILIYPIFTPQTYLDLGKKAEFLVNLHWEAN